MASSPCAPHMVLFPFMSKGHTIPILHLARQLLHRHATVTIFTTPANRPFISNSLANTDASIVDLPFPENVDGLPAGVESTDKLPSMSLFMPFVNATKLMQPDFEQALKALPFVTCLISDGFLCWTVQSTAKFGIPRLVSFGWSYYSMCVSRDAGVNGLFSGPESDDEPFTLTSFPWIKHTRNDFGEPFNVREPKGPFLDFAIEQIISISKSYGLIMNSFHGLEGKFIDYWNRECEPKAWSIGPLCLAEPQRNELQPNQKPTWMQWLDKKLAQGSSVLYIAFGSQAEISSQQLHEIATSLEESKVNFLWVLRKSESELADRFEERVKEKGIVVREWVDQRAILGHESVQGFLSHCGWNSVLESICAKVPILAWPMMAEQHLNASMVVEEIKVGLRVETSNGPVRGFVKWQGLAKMVRELMEGEMGKEVRNNVGEFGEAAKKAMKEGGSSWHTLNQLIDELQALRDLEMVSSSTNNSNIRLKPRLCNCGRTAAIHIVRTNENGNKGRLFFVCPSKYTETPNCNYFKFVDEDDEDVTFTIRSNTRASDGVTVEDFNELRRRLYDVENEHDDYGRRLRMVENILKAMVYLIVFSILLYFMM